jgi:hypothetical protein
MELLYRYKSTQNQNFVIHTECIAVYNQKRFSGKQRTSYITCYSAQQIQADVSSPRMHIIRSGGTVQRMRSTVDSTVWSYVTNGCYSRVPTISHATPAANVIRGK